MATTAALIENSRQGINFQIAPCIVPGAPLSPNPRWGCGHRYDETPVGLVVYVRNDPVNKIDPDGKDWLGPDGIWYPNIDGGTVTVTAEPDETDTIPDLPPLFSEMNYDADVDPNSQGSSKDDHPGGSIVPPQQPKPPCDADGFRSPTAQDSLGILQSAIGYLGTPYLSGAGARSTRNGTDCSGLINCVLSDMAIPYTYRTTRQISASNNLVSVPADQVRPGDIALFPGHAGIVETFTSATDFTVISAQSGLGRVASGRDDYFGLASGFYRPGRVPCNR
jgi:hypothetical protein